MLNRLGSRALGLKFGDIRTGCERLATGPTNDQHTRVCISLHCLYGGSRRFPHIEANGIVARGVVDDQIPDTINGTGQQFAIGVGIKAFGNQVAPSSANCLISASE